MELYQFADTGLYLVDPSQPQKATWGALLYGNQRPDKINLGALLHKWADGIHCMNPA